MRLQCQFDDSDFSFRSLNEPYRYRTQQVIMQVEASTQHIQIPKSSIFEGRRNSGLEGSRMTSWTDMLWNWSHSCDLLQHLWSSFLSSEMTQLRHSDGACAKWLPNFSVTPGKCSDGESNFIGWSHLQPEGRGAVSSVALVQTHSGNLLDEFLNCLWNSERLTHADRHTHTHNLNDFESLYILLFLQCFNTDRPSFFFAFSRSENFQVHCLLHLAARDSDRSWGSGFQSPQEAWRFSAPADCDCDFWDVDVAWCGHSSDRFFGRRRQRRAAQNLQRFVDRGTLPHKWGTQLLLTGKAHLWHVRVDQKTPKSKVLETCNL